MVAFSARESFGEEVSMCERYLCLVTHNALRVVRFRAPFLFPQSIGLAVLILD